MSDDIEVNLDGAVLDQESNDGMVAVDICETNRPQYGRKGWQEYVLSLLGEDEAVQVQGKIYPKCAGLRRVAELLLGDIVFYGPVKVFPSADGNSPGRSSVLAEVHIAWTRADNTPFYNSPDINIPNRVFADASDTWVGNCAEPYVNHGLATATTKALSRALKNALCINVHTAEEMAGNPKYNSEILEEKKLDEVVEANVAGPITSSQTKFIEVLAKKLSIDCCKLSEKQYKKPVDKLTKSEASDLIQELQRHQSGANNGTVDIPDDIRV